MDGLSPSFSIALSFLVLVEDNAKWRDETIARYLPYPHINNHHRSREGFRSADRIQSFPRYNHPLNEQYSFWLAERKQAVGGEVDSVVLAASSDSLVHARVGTLQQANSRAYFCNEVNLLNKLLNSTPESRRTGCEGDHSQ